jgi:hypothetical protein
MPPVKGVDGVRRRPTRCASASVQQWRSRYGRAEQQFQTSGTKGRQAKLEGHLESRSRRLGAGRRRLEFGKECIKHGSIVDTGPQLEESRRLDVVTRRRHATRRLGLTTVITEREGASLLGGALGAFEVSVAR